jgi:hypothetical protein
MQRARITSVNTSASCRNLSVAWICQQFLAAYHFCCSVWCSPLHSTGTHAAVAVAKVLCTKLKSRALLTCPPICRSTIERHRNCSSDCLRTSSNPTGPAHRQPHAREVAEEPPGQNDGSHVGAVDAGATGAPCHRRRTGCDDGTGESIVTVSLLSRRVSLRAFAWANGTKVCESYDMRGDAFATPLCIEHSHSICQPPSVHALPTPSSPSHLPSHQPTHTATCALDLVSL